MAFFPGEAAALGDLGEQARGRESLGHGYGGKDPLAPSMGPEKSESW